MGVMGAQREESGEEEEADKRAPPVESDQEARSGLGELRNGPRSWATQRNRSGLRDEINPEAKGGFNIDFLFKKYKKSKRLFRK